MINSILSYLHVPDEGDLQNDTVQLNQLYQEILDGPLAEIEVGIEGFAELEGSKIFNDYRDNFCARISLICCLLEVVAYKSGCEFLLQEISCEHDKLIDQITTALGKSL